MSITDELRKYTEKQIKWLDVSKVHYRKLFEIADRIDAEHERVRAESIIDMTDERMAEHGWILLPKDAHDECIHIGDEMEFSAFEVEKPVTRMVDGIGQGVFFDWCGERGYQQHEAKRYRHHHAPTVEDVLREFFSRYVTTKTKEEDDAIVAEYAAKFQLRGDAE